MFSYYFHNYIFFFFGYELLVLICFFFFLLFAVLFEGGMVNNHLQEVSIDARSKLSRALSVRTEHIHSEHAIQLRYFLESTAIRTQYLSLCARQRITFHFVEVRGAHTVAKGALRLKLLGAGQGTAR